MGKISKPARKKHNEACQLLEKERLSFEDKLFVLEHWREDATNNNADAGAFFTPYGLARDFALEVRGHGARTIDLCAGAGSLALQYVSKCELDGCNPDITCVELNASYVEVGRKIVPEAKWVTGSALDPGLLLPMGRFEQAISNPPFGSIKTGMNYENFTRYKGKMFDLLIVAVAAEIAGYGAFILPQMSTPFKYSGHYRFEDLRDSGHLPQKVKSFIKQTGLEFQFNTGIDTSVYQADWHGVSPLCEIVCFDFQDEVDVVEEPPAVRTRQDVQKEPQRSQMELFA